MKNKNISTFIGFDNEYDESKIVVFGAPFDGTTSFRPGTRFAPEVMRRESYGLETYSPYLEKDLENYKVFDGGDLEFSFGNPGAVLDSIYKYTEEILKDDKVPFMVGGEHLVSYGSIKAVYEKYPNLHVIHLDAHADLRADYMGEQFSHASVIRRCWDFLGDGKIYQFGIRSGCKEEFLWAKDHTYMEKYSMNTLSEIVDKLKDVPVYITIDLDILDPSIFPGTGTPEPGGITFKEMMDGIKEFEKLNVVGGDIVELSPSYDTSGASTATACKVLREVVLTMV
ncbi:MULTISPECIES: agmatinase [Psychrilyobacter]|uniref:Agmatinase n=1 Tax=Psychrilyobacter piezotolerans TaxID=2293438 RepID=A0ABX9KG72_9FUSO|nr:MULTISPECIES: agmatinase [Psychrilyobacter]MCS5422832.1 agmatinase [Psychrilyobacter sp. S5]NDI78370.1 agmatinase [Psychrilyobacter piezotolerans]RDE61097.1 agmatinase [Psychrilyobacter sp. S5]REI40738.1 agmatinase [Psychrilyobacter piezotolerans]